MMISTVLTLRKIRRLESSQDDDFAINKQETLLSMFNKVSGMISMVGLFITGLSLFVGGIGIMNIMFVSVTERTKEIGLRRSLGAHQRTILLQFLLEAMVICLAGGVIGLLIAWGLKPIINIFLPSAISLKTVVTALIISAVTGMIAGYVPALRAARMDPVEALRND